MRRERGRHVDEVINVGQQLAPAVRRERRNRLNRPNVPFHHVSGDQAEPLVDKGSLVGDGGGGGVVVVVVVVKVETTG